MTAPIPASAAIPQAVPQPGSRLEQLLDMRETAIAAFNEAKKQLEAIKAGIESEVAGTYPGAPVIDIAGAPHRPPLRLRYHQGSWYVPAEALRKTYPAVWDGLRKQQRGHWELHPLDRGGQ